MKRFNSKELQIIIIAAVTQMATSFIGGMIQVALPLISGEMNLTIQLANWVSLSYMVALIAVSIPLGKVISKYGVKRYTIYGIIVLIAGLAMSALSFDINILLFSRVIQGLMDTPGVFRPEFDREAHSLKEVMFNGAALVTYGLGTSEAHWELLDHADILV